MIEQIVRPISLGFAESFLGNRNGETTSALASDAIADIIGFFTGRRPSRETVMPWFHTALIIGGTYGVYRMNR